MHQADMEYYWSDGTHLPNISNPTGSLWGIDRAWVEGECAILRVGFPFLTERRCSRQVEVICQFLL